MCIFGVGPYLCQIKRILSFLQVTNTVGLRLKYIIIENLLYVTE